MGDVLQGGHYKKLFGPFGFWQKDRHSEGDYGRRYPSRPQHRDMTGGLTANSEVLYGLFYGTIPELQFASPMAYTPAKVPAMLMGIPTPRAKDAKTQKVVSRILENLGEELPLISETALIIGTAWRWVRWSRKLNRVIWEVIPDETIADIELDIDTNEIMAIWTHEQIRYTDGYNVVKYAERKRRIGRDTVQIWWTGTANNRLLRSETYKNPFGFIPIPFGHECKETDWRGHSIFSRNLRLFKTCHEIQLNRDQILSKFEPKLKQKVAADYLESWLKNNGYEGTGDIDPFNADVFINAGADEETEFMYLPGDATRQHTEALNDNYKRLIIGSGVPELFWGGLATGNHASTETQKDLGVEYIRALRRELNRPYTVAFNQTLTIMGFMEQTRYTEVINEWGHFEMVSKEVQARIFSTVMQGLSVLIQNASMGYDDMLYFIKAFYPEGPVQTREQLKEAMAEMMKDHTLQLKGGDVYSETDDDLADGDEPPVDEAGEDSEEGDGDEVDEKKKKDMEDDK
jgi:hypothetical protein